MVLKEAWFADTRSLSSAATLLVGLLLTVSKSAMGDGAFLPLVVSPIAASSAPAAPQSANGNSAQPSGGASSGGPNWQTGVLIFAISLAVILCIVTGAHRQGRLQHLSAAQKLGLHAWYQGSLV
jgi:hypothetical protein